jgi:hypothetical protein
MNKTAIKMYNRERQIQKSVMENPKTQFAGYIHGNVNIKIKSCEVECEGINGINMLCCTPEGF